MSRNRNIFFNELSQHPYTETEEEAAQKLHTFFELLDALYNYDGLDVARFRIGHDEYLQWKIYPTETIQEVIDKPAFKKYQDFFYTHFDSPVVEKNSELEQRITEENPKLVWADKELPCVGLAAAYYEHTLAISFDNDSFWRSVVFKLKINDKDDTVIALADKEYLNDERFKAWIVQVRPTEIPISETDPDKKRCHLSGDHHGKDVLKRLWKKLKYKIYVEECICSLEFSGKVTDPILKVYDDGIIDIVDITNDEGFAMKVRTTARDKYETMRVAEMIREWLK